MRGGNEMTEPRPIPPTVKGGIIYKALCDINNEIGVISKSQKNKQQGFNYRGIDDVMNDLHALFVKNRVIILPEVTEERVVERQSKAGGSLFCTHLSVNYHFTAEDGSSVTARVKGEAMDSGDKGTNKALAVALKYVLLQMFLIPTAEAKDPDADTHQVKPQTLSADLFKKALERIEGGEHDLIDKIEGTYTLSVAQRGELNTVIDNLNIK